MVSINIAAVLVAAFAAFMVGFLWHGPVFGAQWIKMMGISEAEVKAAQAKGMGPMIPQMIAAFFQQIVVAAVMSHIASVLAVTGAAEAILFAILLWLGFIVTSQLNTVLWEKRKMNLYLFTVSYHLVSMMAISLIVVLWK
jgi:hypothetical protein